MNIILGNIKRNSNTTLDVEVIVEGTIIGTHRYNRKWHSHSIIEDSKLESDLLTSIFQVTKVLVNDLVKSI